MQFLPVKEVIYLLTDVPKSLQWILLVYSFLCMPGFFILLTCFPIGVNQVSNSA